jgi:hypothetical protein
VRECRGPLQTYLAIIVEGGSLPVAYSQKEFAMHRRQFINRLRIFFGGIPF